MSYRVKMLLAGVVLVLLVICSVCLLYRLGYQDGWNDRGKIMEVSYHS